MLGPSHSAPHKRLRLIDPRARGHLGRYALQCLLAAVMIWVVFLLLDTIIQVGLTASLGATSFIVFAMPKARSARPRALLGGYAVGSLIGAMFSLVLTAVLQTAWPVPAVPFLLAMGATAVGCSMFVMSVTNTEHPPAAGLALGFVLEPWDWSTVLVVLCAGILFTLVRWALRNVLIDLV